MQRPIDVEPPGCHRRPATLPGMGKRGVVKAGQRRVSRGKTPVYLVRVAPPVVVEMPWLEFGGDRTFEVLDAARRAIAGELHVRPEQIEVRAD